MTTQTRPTIFQRTRRVLGRGYELITIQELKIARALQNKIPCGYILTRILGLLFKLALIVFLVFIGSWILFGVLAIMAFWFSDSKTSQQILEETIGSSEHHHKYPWRYDEDGNYK
ncbi:MULTISPECIES: hypothetical protein [Entomomonas]|uniref:DUF3742 family protein n=1 Tax=Entomomonas asaccharolytica TaxID=2785331 RepID=A0A974NHQ9_9GAMM|nr:MULTISPECIES: hypothetical protein [Entomomonas]QQP86863.1 hypothetical protein JHT90_06370 [Entomomonas asaccharolytica]UYZ83519.1 hypothetical protein MTZ49_13085 [Entomomonas sp. E2T0]